MREEQAIEEGKTIEKSEEEQPQGGTLIMGMTRKLCVVTATLALAALGGAAPTLAASAPHPQVGEFGSFTNPNGIAIDESNRDVYVADIATNTVYKFDENGNPVNFLVLGSNALTGSGAFTNPPTGQFSFPSSAYGTPAAIAVDNSKSSPDPSAGDLYVMDAGHGVIDKFSPSGEYLSQITGFAPATGSEENELLGLAVDADGNVRVDYRRGRPGDIAVNEYDDSEANHLYAKQLNQKNFERYSGLSPEYQKADGYAVGPQGDDYLLYQSCSCVVKFGQHLAPLGKVDPTGSGDLAATTDPATGHLYVQDQSSIVEWDTGAMNGSYLEGEGEPQSVGTRLGEFGSPSGSSSQGGIAVDSASGRIYVSNPGTGKVDVFGSDAPAVSAGEPNNITETTATLNGSVNPRGVSIGECKFEYGVADEWGRAKYEHTVACAQAPGAGTSAAPVSASIAGLQAGLLYRFRLIAVNADGLSGESAGLLATAGEGFGVKRFEVSFLNRDGTPDTQAGSHPYKMLNTIEFNSHYLRTESNADSPYVLMPDGTVKDLTLDFPPGTVGNPNATERKCTSLELREGEGACKPEALLGDWHIVYTKHVLLGTYQFDEPMYNIAPPEGVAVQLGVHFEKPDLFINGGVAAGGDYPAQAVVLNAPTSAPVLVSAVTVFGDPAEAGAELRRKELERELGVHPIPMPIFTPKAFWTLPTSCNGPLRSTIKMDSYQEPGHFVTAESVEIDSAGQPVSMTGCSKLKFPPEISATPDTTDASTASGLTVHVKVPQTAVFNPEGLAESALRDTTVTLPEGVAINPSGGDGLAGCTSDEGALSEAQEAQGVLGTPGDQIGFKGWKNVNKSEPDVPWATFSSELPNPLMPGSNFCPDGSKIASVKIRTPLLEHELEGSMYLATQNANPFKSLMAMYMVAEDKYSGTVVKVVGEVKLSATGQIVSTFENFPAQPFEDAEIHFFGGERAPLATPSQCGKYTTKAVFTPWNGNPPVTSESSFNIDHGPNGGPCPGGKLPFNPAFTGGSTNLQAGAFTPLTGTFSRQDGEQQITRLHFTLPPGLSGVLTGVKLCNEADANAGTCGPGSLIGETTVAAGVGSDPITVSGGKVYLTGPYKGAPFGLSVVDPVKAGPFDLEKDTSNPSQNPACDCVVVRAKLEIDPLTAAVTITSNSEAEGFAIPHLIDGIPVELKKINFTTTRNGFQFNPTNCEKMSISGSAESDEREARPVGVPFQVTNCAALKFKPSFKVTTSGKTSRLRGASLHVDLSYPKAPFGSQANIRMVKVDLPKQLPSNLEALKRACVDTTFESNPAACPAESRVGFAKAITPILPVPLEGPAYFVSHGGAKFPELIVVLQGYGITIDLHGETFIKHGITSSTFHTVPDQPVESFELTLPQRARFSALAAPGGLCNITRTVLVKRKVKVRSKGHTRAVTRRVRHKVAGRLLMPTMFTAQNGMVIHQNTPIEVTGCAKHKKTKHRTSRRGRHRHKK